MTKPNCSDCNDTGVYRPPGSVGGAYDDSTQCRCAQRGGVNYEPPVGELKLGEFGRGWQAEVTSEIPAETWRGSEDVIFVGERCSDVGSGESYEKKISVTRYHWPRDLAANGTMSTFIRGGRSATLTLDEARELHRQLGLVLELDADGRPRS